MIHFFEFLTTTRLWKSEGQVFESFNKFFFVYFIPNETAKVPEKRERESGQWKKLSIQSKSFFLSMCLYITFFVSNRFRLSSTDWSTVCACVCEYEFLKTKNLSRYFQKKTVRKSPTNWMNLEIIIRLTNTQRDRERERHIDIFLEFAYDDTQFQTTVLIYLYKVWW